ncbi:energy-coupling factor transporter transmembrane component T family protein [Halopenitus persicus]|uniref:Energy-coupling factor transport system permease protein n=1 Tax=Halopenitus persicus TaxID=1048396 RepID=A0A1H3J1Z3_9EURY|nr:energy-coupling factor transporter transmembrane component T [Halopenitus persicus]QHS17350.1 energy-coupling factor transporter transmembrane protein EcfT [haloarchaeon 3A1-DGR]SDY34023.1 energy-coupling factor transport system permease protein [Halopenitus persicus]
MSATSLYVDRGTWIHRLDARSTLAFVLAIFVSGYIFDDPRFAAVPLVVAFVSLVAVGGWPNFKRLSPIVAALFVVGLVVWPLFTGPGGPTVIDLGPLVLSERELLFALGRSERIAVFIVGGLLFVTTTSNEEIVSGMRQLGVPFAFCFAVGTALRLFPTFIDAAGTVKQAQEARGLDLSDGNLIERLRSFVPLLVPVFMTAFRNVNTQSMALEARGFDTRRDRTFYGASSMGGVDWVVTVASLAVIVGVVALRLAGYGTL